MTLPPADDDALLRERAARYAAEAARFMLDQALSAVSHDLRSPLNAMHSWAYVLERQLASGDAGALRALAGVRSGIEQQTKLLETTVDAARADTRMLAIRCETCRLDALLDECAALARAALATARSTSIAIDNRIPDGAALVADRERLAQAVWTMLAFAAEASAPASAITLVCARTADGQSTSFSTTLDVSAAALADAALPHAFEGAARREALAVRGANRPAWALALCQRVAHAHDGTFVHSPLEDGAHATLTLTLPNNLA